LADETDYEVLHLVAGGGIWCCLLLAGHVMNYGGRSDLYKKGDLISQAARATACRQSFKLRLCHHTKEAWKILMMQVNYSQCSSAVWHLGECLAHCTGQ